MKQPYPERRAVACQSPVASPALLGEEPGPPPPPHGGASLRAPEASPAPGQTLSSGRLPSSLRKQLEVGQPGKGLECFLTWRHLPGQWVVSAKAAPAQITLYGFSCFIAKQPNPVSAVVCDPGRSPGSPACASPPISHQGPKSLAIVSVQAGMGQVLGVPPLSPPAPPLPPGVL